METTQGEPRATIHDVIFSGKKGEYFKLWLVNMLLSVVTLGIYSAWAKVRNTRYMFGHTQIGGHGFRYLAEPLRILKGRIVALVLLVLFTWLSELNPVVGGGLMLLFIVAMPWLILQSLRFNLRMTTYRNVGFSFSGSYWGVVVNFILLPILGYISFFIAMPWVMKRIDQYIHGHVSYGGKAFSVNTETGVYYLAALAALGVSIVGLSLALIVFGGGAALSMETLMSFGAGAFVFLYIAMLLVMILVTSVYRCMIRNHLFQAMQITDVVELRSNVTVGAFTWLNLSNLLLLICTLGLAFPVTQVRQASYLAGATKVKLHPGVDALLNTVQANDSAIGEETAGMFDVDFSLI
ncbi:uncharacterized membrane protein YjgN (DUF898 family) [Sinobacterium caligoides]|uniref:Uncharacterized membrane protein YjgN (DUF898 family) n=1 Tax=Sinobacterium caligoides TaxID=933926 RepID=A0A3N2DRF7_9GAMM|nr:YjgN family protein [Sinobacterium caligoides]ROS01885.1 uncharacterized membrane protein YjgN (DUF898 family) [Sinobacterium caligoides]